MLGGLLFFIVIGGICLLITVGVAKGHRVGDSRSDLQFESDLQQARSRSNGAHGAWTAPKLPPSVIASIWTGRFVISPTPSVYSGARPTSVLWDPKYSRDARHIVAAAFLSLRDAGLIRMFVAEPGNRFLHAYERVTVERTDLALSGLQLPNVEGGLLLAIEAFPNKRFGKTTRPSANSVVKEWIHQTQNNPYKWVVGVAVQQGRELGLYQAVTKKRIGFGDKPAYSLEHLAACEDQVVACVERWRNFAVNEPELHQRLVTESAFGIHGRQAASG